jgi:hypothetical protein
MVSAQDQQHPQEKSDRQTVNRLMTEEATDENLADLARLRIRYRNFPGARDIQKDLNLTLRRWELTEEELFEKTRQIYQKGQIYRRFRGNLEDDQDWS